MVQPPVKHVISNAILGAASAANQTVVIAQGVLNPDPYTNNNNIKAANKIFATHIMIDWSPASGGAIGDYTFSWYIAFNINGAQPMPTVDNTGASHINSQIFMEEFALQITGTAASAASPPSHAWRTVLRLPKSWSTFNDGDQLELHYTTAGPASALHDIKYKFIYKEVYP